MQCFDRRLASAILHTETNKQTNKQKRFLWFQCYIIWFFFEIVILVSVQFLYNTHSQAWHYFVNIIFFITLTTYQHYHFCYSYSIWILFHWINHNLTCHTKTYFGYHYCKVKLISLRKFLYMLITNRYLEAVVLPLSGIKCTMCSVNNKKSIRCKISIFIHRSTILTFW